MARTRKLFLCSSCLTPYQRISQCGILCENDRIIGIGGASGFSLTEQGLQIIDLQNCLAVPGFIDSHIHGICGFDANQVLTSMASLADMSMELAKHGVTTFCPTALAGSGDDFLQNIDSLAFQIGTGVPGAVPAGIHVEGPFLNPEKRGSISQDCIREIDLGFFREIVKAGRNRIKVMTFAPELPHSDKLIEAMLENGIIPSMGHSLADEAQTLRAIEAGATRCTYIFNAMAPLSHRTSSLTTVALTDNRVAIEVIVDGVHVHPRVIELISRCKPADKIIGISNAETLTPRSSFKEETASNSEKIITTRDGILSGSTLTLEKSWFHLKSFANMPETAGAACFTVNPAQDLGLFSRGVLRPGKRADIAFFDPDTNEVRMTVILGNIVYDRNASSENQ